MKRLLIVSLFLPLFSFANNKDTSLVQQKRNNVMIELLGNGLFYSIKYERLIFVKENKMLGAYLGYSYLPFNRGFKSQTFPFGLSFILGKKPWRLEAALGGTLINYFNPIPATKAERDFYKENKPIYQDSVFIPPLELVFTPNIGVRYSRGNFNFRFFVSALLKPDFYYGSFKSQPKIGLSVGKYF